MFIAGGAFVGLTDILRSRLQGSSIGFGAEVKSKNRKMEVDKGPSYQYSICAVNKKDAFLKKIKRTENGSDE